MNPNRIHIIGIGGTGMNGIAQLAAQAGYQVTGSDRADSGELFACLKSLGIRIFPQDGSGITAETGFVVYSTAIEPDNPDIRKAVERGIPLLHRAEMLARLCEGKQVIAVAGTAGKSTVTGLLGWIFECLGKDPSVYCGAPVLNWKQSGSGIPAAGQRLDAKRGFRNESSDRQERQPSSTLGNVRYGSGPWIIEADESDKSFLKFHPQHAIITNIAEDHYPLEELHRLFDQFESQVSGVTIREAESFAVPIRMPGKHNAANVNHALTLCRALGLDMKKCKAAAGSFLGIERRLQRHGPKVIDDFAHSPVKISAALEAVAGEFAAFHAVWRPHGYTPLFQGVEAFTECFSAFSRAHPDFRIFILPVFYAGGSVNIRITSEQFVEKLLAAGVPAEFAPDFPTLKKRLTDEALPILIMGARDPDLPRFARDLAAVIG